jgi:hypothetical protein
LQFGNPSREHLSKTILERTPRQLDQIPADAQLSFIG